ncbi:MAG: hypothetical protein KA184_21560 [Candidatus Hydrogenedentes bacterium]|nr:hypothetical protein [Candidatus Hydrogenedentota bacterium]
MPCSDVTELIRVTVDAQDRLKSYRFIKKTCGRAVGAEALLLGALGGCSVGEILELTPERFLGQMETSGPIEEFLSLKHLVAVQSALEVLTGGAPGGPGRLCAVAEITFDEGETVIDARISVDLLTNEIKSCGNCRSCGAAKGSKRVVFL